VTVLAIPIGPQPNQKKLKTGQINLLSQSLQHFDIIIFDYEPHYFLRCFCKMISLKQALKEKNTGVMLMLFYCIDNQPVGNEDINWLQYSEEQLLNRQTFKALPLC